MDRVMQYRTDDRQIPGPAAGQGGSGKSAMTAVDKRPVFLYNDIENEAISDTGSPLGLPYKGKER